MMGSSNIFQVEIAIFFILAAVVFTAPNSSAQVSSADGSPPVSAAQFSEVLWDQIGTAEGTGVTAQNFTDPGGVFDNLDSRAADDFEVPGATIWNIETLRASGFYLSGPGPIQSLNVVFFEDNGSLPGGSVPGCEYSNIQPQNVLDPNFIINLPEPCTLTSGTYWVSVQVNMSFNPGGQWFWMTIIEQNLNLFVWENPQDGFNHGCTSWTPGPDCIALTGPDLSFQLIGEPLAAPRPIPTLSQWGLIAMAGVLGLLGAVFIRRTRLSHFS